jgi:hypothetical protein
MIAIPQGQGMTCWSVSPRVGKAKNNDPSLIGRSAMKLLNWLTAAFILLLLVDCAAGQGPPPPAPSPHDNGSDIRGM